MTSFLESKRPTTPKCTTFPPTPLVERHSSLILRSIISLRLAMIVADQVWLALHFTFNLGIIVHTYFTFSA
jgi:hypothetical protein